MGNPYSATLLSGRIHLIGGLSVDSNHLPSGASMEFAQVVAAGPDWQRVRAELVVLRTSGATEEQIVAQLRTALTREGLGGEAQFASIPADLMPLYSPEAREAIIEALDLRMIASLRSDVESGSPLPFESIGAGARVIEINEGEVSFKVVVSMVTPFDNPNCRIAEFIDVCYGTFDASVFARHPNSERDAHWWRRHEEGCTYRQIAVDDSRSGLPPEAVATPDEYGPEIARATDRVRRAVKRFRARWTRKVDLLSKKPG